MKLPIRDWWIPVKIMWESRRDGWRDTKRKCDNCGTRLLHNERTGEYKCLDQLVEIYGSKYL